MDTELEFQPFPKMGRLFRDIVITEKIDGTNASIYIEQDGTFLVGSRTKWITPEDDNYGFAKWAYSNQEALVNLLGPGHHFGEWWGQGIQRRYDMKNKVFSLFNSKRWGATDLSAVPNLSVVPVLYEGLFSEASVKEALITLEREGSYASPGFMKPEGIVVYHMAAGVGFKYTIGDDGHKGT